MKQLIVLTVEMQRLADDIFEDLDRKMYVTSGRFRRIAIRSYSHIKNKYGILPLKK